MVMLDIDSDTSTVVPFGNTFVQVNCGVGSPVAVQLRTAGAGERTSTSRGSPSTVTETMDKIQMCKNISAASTAMAILVYEGEKMASLDCILCMCSLLP